MSFFKKIVAVGVATMVMTMPFTHSLAQTIVKDTKLSTGVQYKQYTYTNGNKNSINHLAIDLNDPYTKVKLGLPSPLYQTQTVTTMANRDSRLEHQVVGAVNAGFFDMYEGFPLQLIAQKNTILSGGRIVPLVGEYVSQPIAFGINANQKAVIEDFDFDIKMTYKGQSYDISGLNRERRVDESILFTPQNYKGSTNSNPYGFEIVFDTGATIQSNYFGQVLKGKMVSKRPHGSTLNTAIPKTGFVISVQTGSPLYTMLNSTKVGEEVSIQLSINQAWNNAEFILATGPQLVKDGKVNLGIAPTSYRAKQITARTVVGVSKDNSKVHLITVDGLQSHSQGMNMTQLAQYMVSLGVDRAINLDGGGSTTMGIRQPGAASVTLANKPSDGAQRRVSAILQAVSTAPITYSIAGTKSLMKGSSTTFKLSSVKDSVGKPVSYNASAVKWSVEGNIGQINASGVFKATNAGKGKIIATLGSQSKSIEVTVSLFKDLLTGSLYSTEVNYLVSKGIINGYNDNTFKPNDKLTRQHGAVIIARALGLNTSNVKNPNFKDVPTTHLYYKEIAAIQNAGIMSGQPGGNFSPKDNLTRSQMAKVIANAYNLQGIWNKQFKDVGKDTWHYPFVQALAANGVTTGYNDGTFKPADYISRVHFGLFLYRTLN